MRVPQVSERIKEAPAQALRGVFAGIGQLLLITDKLRNKTPADTDAPRASKPEAAQKATATSPADQRGQTAAPAEPAAAPAEPVTAPAEPAAAPAEPVTAEAVVAAPATAEAVVAAPATAEAVVADEVVGADEAVATAPAGAEPAGAEPAGAEPAAAEPAAAAKPTMGRRSPAKPTTAKPAARPATAKPATARRAAAKPTPTGPAGAEPPKPPKRQSPRDFDKTGNVRLLGDEDDGSALSAPEPVAAAEPASGSAGSAPPLPNYDELSVASLRARLRNLDVAQVRQLAEYERTHAARADVLAMFERRIVKLETDA